MPPEAGRLVADPNLVEQLLANLVDNAVRYTERGSITIGAAPEGGELALWVEDTGIGIPEAHFARIFERFHVVDPARSRELGGTGLGLAIVKHIAMLHGGRVEVASRVGQGSRFTVRLPGASTDDDLQAVARLPRRAGRSSTGRDGGLPLVATMATFYT